MANSAKQACSLYPYALPPSPPEADTADTVCLAPCTLGLSCAFRLRQGFGGHSVPCTLCLIDVYSFEKDLISVRS